MARQGDVLIIEVAELPHPVYRRNRTVAIGEGHHEHVVVGDADVLLDDDGEMFVRVWGDASLKHVVTGTDEQAEHLPIEIPTGLYRVLRQRQYNPYDGRVSGIAD